MKTRYKVLLAFLLNGVIAALIFFLFPEYAGLTAITGALFFGYVLYLSQNYFQGKRKGSD